MRPRFPHPESVTVIPWPRYVKSLKRVGLWDKIVQRMVATGSREIVGKCNQCYEKLLEHFGTNSLKGFGFNKDDLAMAITPSSPIKFFRKSNISILLIAGY